MTTAKYEPMFPTTEGDLWRWQREAMDDLAAFLDQHAPNKPAPLPAVDWRINTHHTVSAEVSPHATDPSGIRANRRNVVEAYAEALGVEVKTAELRNKTRYHATGRIGRREGTKQEPRTTLHISAEVWNEDDEA